MFDLSGMRRSGAFRRIGNAIPGSAWGLPTCVRRSNVATGSDAAGNSQGNGTMRLVGSAAFLAALWLLMSGIYKPLVIGFGLLSVATVLFITRRMDRADRDRLVFAIRPVGLVRYLVWLLVEIARANWAVTRLILSRTMPLRQVIFDVPSSQSTDIGRTLFANSITLTPGTISVETVEENNVIQVHAVAYEENDPAALADMDRRVTAVETGKNG